MNPFVLNTVPCKPVLQYYLSIYPPLNTMTESHKVASELLEAFKAQDISKFRNLFYSPLTFVLTNYRVGTLLGLANFLLGPLESWTDPELHQSGRITVYKTLCKFQRGNQALTLRIWGNKAMGVGIVNAADVGLGSPWKAPSYVDDTSFSEKEVFIRPYWIWPGTKGTLNTPKVSPGDRRPAILFVPGSGAMDRDAAVGGTKCFKDLAYGLATAGSVTLRMDKPLPVITIKQVLLKTCTVQDEYITPLSAALKYLAAHPAVDPAQIFLLGGSLGGMVAPRLCQASPVPIAGIVSCAGASLPLAKTMATQLEYLQRHFPRPNQEDHDKEVAQWEAIQRCVETGGLQRGQQDPTKDLPIPLPLSYLQDLYDNDPVEAAKTLDVPMLFVQGKRDWQVGMEHFLRWQTGLEGSKAIEKAEWKVYDDVGHVMSAVDGEKYGTFQYSEPANVKKEVVEDIIDFVRRVVEK